MVRVLSSVFVCLLVQAHIYGLLSPLKTEPDASLTSLHRSPSFSLPSRLYSWLHKVRQCRRQLLIYGQWQVRFSHRLLRLVFVSATAPPPSPLPPPHLHFSLLLMLTSLLLSPCIDLCIGRQCVRCPPHSCINRTCCLSLSLSPVISALLSLSTAPSLFLSPRHAFYL